MAVSWLKEEANCFDSFGSIIIRKGLIALIAIAVSWCKEVANCSDSYGSITV